MGGGGGGEGEGKEGGERRGGEGEERRGGGKKGEGTEHQMNTHTCTYIRMCTLRPHLSAHIHSG